MYQRIRELREDRSLTQTQIAKYLNCSRQTYGKYERGEVDIPTHIFIKLARFHNTNIDYLLNITDVTAPYPKDRTL